MWAGFASGVDRFVASYAVIRAADNGQPVAGAAVQAFTDFARRIGERATSRSTGNVFLRLPASTSKLERLYIDPTRGYWSLLLHDVRITDGDTFEVRPIEPGHVDVLRHFYARPVADPGAGVRVAVVDTGVGDHSDLTVGGGRNAVPGEDPGAWGDNGMGHGTHVAGIIAGKGASGSARGIAPAVDLRSYRVFAQNRQSAKSYPIAKAIEYAVADGCDLINLSLSDAHPDALTDTYITRARDTGAVVIAAAGNDGRRPVNFPARLQDVVAVAAMGRDGLFPADSADAIEVVKPFGADEKNFIAGFSNVGPQVRLVGPGVGVISTMPGGLFGAQSGTSMACPAVTGVAARLLSAKKTILNMKRDRKRSDAIVELLLGSARTLGFQPDFEGYGMPGADDGE